MTRQANIPGFGFINETGARQANIPGFGFINETGAATSPGTASPAGVSAAFSLGSSVGSGKGKASPSGLLSSFSLGTATAHESAIVPGTPHIVPATGRASYPLSFDGTYFTFPANVNDLIAASISGGWGFYNTSTFAPIPQTEATLAAAAALSGHTFYTGSKGKVWYSAAQTEDTKINKIV
jgi:hypothetical protein